MESRAKGVDLLEERLTHSIIQSFYDVYNHYGFGLLESVYANALAIDLRSKGHTVQREVRIVVYYMGEPASRQRLDMVVDDKVIVETKAREKLGAMAQPQLLNYLKATRFELGLLLHFGPTPVFHRVIASKRR